ncbi:hypothetical protein BDD12DRAFT_824056 [Trichophaea hybrida]|nr:hypothetical protein BDD12DRAFT_824056 [Trichophaea hybrida]
MTVVQCTGMYTIRNELYLTNFILPIVSALTIVPQVLIAHYNFHYQSRSNIITEWPVGTNNKQTKHLLLSASIQTMVFLVRKH